MTTQKLFMAIDGENVEYTTEQYAQHEIDKTANTANEAALATQTAALAAAKLSAQNKLAALGLTADEIAAL